MRDLEEPGALGEGLGRGEVCRLYGVEDFLALRLPRKRDEERRSHADDQSLLFHMQPSRLRRSRRRPGPKRVPA